MDEVWLYWVFGGKLESRRGVLEYIDDIYGLISNCTRGRAYFKSYHDGHKYLCSGDEGDEGDEGDVYNGIIWLREDDREKAIDIFVEYYLKKVMKARTDLTAKEMIYETVCTLREKEKE